MRPIFAALIAWAFYLRIWAFCLCFILDGATLHISGTATGNGSQVLEVCGDNLTAWWNGTAWRIEGAM